MYAKVEAGAALTTMEHTPVASVASGSEAAAAIGELEALAELSDALHETHAAVRVLATTTTDLVTDMRTVERKLGTVYLPFKSAVWELEQSGTNSPAFS